MYEFGCWNSQKSEGTKTTKYGVVQQFLIKNDSSLISCIFAVDTLLGGLEGEEPLCTLTIVYPKFIILVFFILITL